jgi:hypothetical protein
MPYVNEIIAGWNAGKSTGQIRSEIWPRCTVSDVMIRYVLTRHGLIKRNPVRHTPVAPPCRYWICWHDMFPPEIKPSFSRPIDMGGPRDVWIERDPWSDQ